MTALPLCAQTASPKFLPFQGRLTDASGKPIADGVRLIQFRILDAPLGGNPVWLGETHRTTINGGLINVVLGTKAPLDGADFSRTLYLDIVVDANGDNQITADDKPLLPRQALIPVPFAHDAESARNSMKLDGYSWTDFFETSDPKTAVVDGAKVKANSLSTSALAREVLDQLVPPGSILAFGGGVTQLPRGWILCDGTPISSKAYPRLFAAISTNWGSGIPGSTNDFNLPDLRGLFLRGVNGLRADTFSDPDVGSRTNLTGGGTGNVVGSVQLDALQEHHHRIEMGTPGAGDGGTGTFKLGAGNNLYTDGRILDVTRARTSSENRPKNAYVNYIIKY